MPHKFELFDAVILEVDRPDDGLLKGAMGVVMDLVEPDGVSVEFFDANQVSTGDHWTSGKHFAP